MSSGLWAVRLSEAAQSDYRGIFRWTAERFGRSQATSYLEDLTGALAKLEGGPAIQGVRVRTDIMDGLMTLHMGRRSRHIVVFKVADTVAGTIDVLRILHDAMDIVRHL